MKNFIPERIFIEKAVLKSKLAECVLKKFSGVEIFKIKSIKEYIKNSPSVSIGRAKKRLFIASQKNGFLKPCPGTPNYMGCNYYILDIAFGCFYDCTYCYLQAYGNFPGIVLYANLEDFFQAVEASFKKYPRLFYRLGTGEFTDSLAFEGIYSYAKELVPFFAGKKAILELKTKGDSVGALLGLDHGRRTAVSWSINPSVIVRNEEKGSLSLDSRLKAARLCSQDGYPVGFHFDPIIIYPDWEEDYCRTVEKLFKFVSGDNICWISLGTLRFPPMMKSIIARRFPESKIIYEEFITGLDGKMRYFKPKRIKVYQKMTSWIRKFAPRVPLYLCMESEDVWQKVFGFRPKCPREVEGILKTSCKYQDV